MLLSLMPLVHCRHVYEWDHRGQNHRHGFPSVLSYAEKTKRLLLEMQQFP